MAVDVEFAVCDLLSHDEADAVKAGGGAAGHEATVDAARLAGGVYVYRITAENLVQMREKILIRYGISNRVFSTGAADK